MPLTGQIHTALAAGASVASQVAPGVLGFLVVAGMGVALFFLLRSMNKQLDKVGAARRTFISDQPQQPPDDNPPNGSQPKP